MAKYRALRAVLLLSLFTLLLGTTWVPVGAQQDARTEKPVETTTPEESTGPEPTSTPPDTSEREQASEPREADGADRVESPDQTNSNDRAVPSGTPTDNPGGDFQAAGEVSVSFSPSTYAIAPGTSAPASVTVDFVHDARTTITVGYFSNFGYSNLVVSSGQPGSVCVLQSSDSLGFSVSADAPVGTAGTCIIGFSIEIRAGFPEGESYTLSARAVQSPHSGASASATVVTGLNGPRVKATDATFLIDEGTSSFSGTLAATAGSGTYRFEEYGQPNNGQVTISESGAFEFLPIPNARYEDQFSFKVFDAADPTKYDFGDVTIRFRRIIQPLVAPDLVVDVAYEGTVTFKIKPTGGFTNSYTGYLLHKDSDVTKGTITSFDEHTGYVTYAAYEGMGGTDSFEYTATDQALDQHSDTGTVTFRIAEPPAGLFEAIPQTYVVDSGKSRSGTLVGTGGVKPYTFAITQAPDSGSITAFDAATGDFTFAAAAEDYYSASFEFSVTDSATTPQTSSATVTFQINLFTPLYARPTAVGPVAPGESVEWAIWDNCGGGFGMGVFAIATQPAQGQASMSADGWLTYVANPDASGTDSFDFTLADVVDGTIQNQVTATITVYIKTSAAAPSPATPPGEVSINPGSGSSDDDGNDDNADPGRESNGEDVSDPRQDGSDGEETIDDSSGEGSGHPDNGEPETDTVNGAESGTGDVVDQGSSFNDEPEAEAGSVIRLPSAGSGTSSGTAPWILAALSLAAVALVALAFGCTRLVGSETISDRGLRDANTSVTDKL